MNIRRYFSGRKLIWWGLFVLLVAFISFQVYKSKHDTSNILVETVKQQDLIQSVLATGQVISNTDLGLSFKGSGIVKKVNVKVGQKAMEDQVLANLDQADELASLTSARGALASAQANYQKVLSGASSEEIEVAQRAVDSANATLSATKAQQQTAVDNAYLALLNSSLVAEPSNSNLNKVSLPITGVYTGGVEGKYNIELDFHEFNLSGLEKLEGQRITEGSAVRLGTKGLYVTFPTTLTSNVSDRWEVRIPNVQGSAYLTNLNAYNAALEAKNTAISAAEASLNQALANLALEKVQAKPADLQAAQAQVLSAQGQVQSAQAALESTIIRAPANGTITAVNIKVGELATASKEVIVLQDIDNLYLEANVSEANVASLVEGQEIDVTFDALGPDREYKAKITTVEPASNVVSGIVNYKITASIDQFAELRPGMTANMSIKTGSRTNVVAVPQRSVIVKNNKKYIRLITDSKSKTFQETEVKTGLEADGGLVEIVSGIQAGAEIVTFIESK